MAGDTCDVCGHKDYIAGVASSSLGAISFCFCRVCLAMGAEQKLMIDTVFETNNFRAQYGKESFCYYNKERDCYVNYGTGEIIPIKLKNGMTFQTRNSLIEHIGTDKDG